MSNLWLLTEGKDPNFEINQAARLRWFNKIAPKDNWKAEIDTWIDRADYEQCAEAAIWFTGGPLEITEETGDKVRVYGAGYYNCIGA